MIQTEIRSTSCAKKVLILGHISTGMGEKTLSLKYQRALERAGCDVLPRIDIIEWMGEKYESLAQLNYDLADGGFDLFEGVTSDIVLEASDLLLLLSWNFSLAAFFATGLQKKQRVVAALHAHHPTERLLAKLYEPANLLLTGSLLAHERALAYNLPAEKLIYMPHVYPAECEDITPSRTYVEKLAKQQGKTLGKSTRIIGCVGRLEYGKNAEFAVEAVRRLATEKEDIVLVLKGDFPPNSPYPDYRARFSRMLEAYQDEPWLLWDKTFTAYPDSMHVYASFDILVHPSGAEVASQVVIECLGLKKPVIVLNCSSNPYLFKDIATFVPTTGEIKPALLPFFIPDLDALCDALRKDLYLPNTGKVQDRFHERILLERIPLLFDSNPDTIKSLYAHDRKVYY